MDIKEKIKELPNSPGVYFLKGENGEVLYIGKSSNLRKRVSSYFRPQRRVRAERLEAMVGRIEDITYITTATEAEALIYENSLIKQLSPRYNVSLRDDKSYPVLKLTVSEKFPRLFMTRQRKEDGSVYYGPYTSARLLKKAVEELRQLFPLRSCGKFAKRPCLNYHIKQCLGPCTGNVDSAHYARIVSELRLFLEGRRTELLKLLSERMREAARKEEFEEAEELKRRIEALSSIKERSVHYRPSGETEELRNILRIKGPLETIEAFDVSNIMGSSAVGSMIYFYKGRPRKSEYRRFRIKTVSRIDDYAMMREIVRRRYARLAGEKRPLPDLVLIDGGKGHLAAALEELGKLGLSRVPAIGIAKEFEHIYVKDEAEPIVLPGDSKALHLLERIRDEAHRFAISYHKSLLSKKIKVSELDAIAGIGGKRKRALLNHFGSVDKIKEAGMDDLLKADGVDEKSARNIIRYFKR